MIKRGNTTSEKDQPDDAPSRSCYILELSVLPGGFRRGELWVAANFEGIRHPLEEELMSGDPEGAYLASCYGETMAVWIVQCGQLAERIDLRPFIHLQVNDHPPISLSEEPAPWLEPITRAVVEHYESDGLAHSVSVKVDWDAVAARLPALESPILGPRQRSVLGVPDSARSLIQGGDFTIINDGIPLELGHHFLGS